MKNNHPSELARGLIQQLDFGSAGSIIRQSGTITGSLQYDSEKGARFDGVNDTVNFVMRSQLFNGGWGMVYEFTPEFTPGDGIVRYLYSAADGQNAGSIDGTGALTFKFGATNIISLVATYIDLWRTNQRNVLVFTGISGTQGVYLNGTLFKSSTNALTAYNHTNIVIGSAYAGGSKFFGHIHSIKFFKHTSAQDLLTAQEAADYYTRSTFRYRARAVVDLPMGAAQHDATNLKTLDVSPYGQHFTWTAGATAPTKLSTVGYRADGGDTFSNAAVIANSTYTVALAIRHSSATGYMADWRGGGGTGYVRLGSAVLLQVSSGTAYVNGKPSTVLAPGNFNVIMVTGIALNGPAGTKLLADNAGATGITGSIHGYAVWPGTLTPLQVRDYTLMLLSGMNRV